MINRPDPFLNRIAGFICWLILFAALVGCDRPIAETTPAPEPASSPITAVEPEPVTLVFNGLIYTFDPGNTVVAGGAMAISATGEILAIGNDEPMKAAYPEAVQHDLQGRAVFPGLIDAHAHFIGLAMTLTQADLVGLLVDAKFHGSPADHRSDPETLAQC